ncbi:flagellar filament capping protein FliD [Halomonas sp. 18071143]|uniref:flagellar filament capping protein FliD n=1 Tax=Halomonas sp. 18071143 TaxID=2855441 RepID=UPI001C47EF7C|nr:flagellar filament capping protein FliD [Halomonas sp. 18071143]
MSTISSLGVGSGLDLNGLLDELEAAERMKLEPIVQQQEKHQTTISAYGQLEGDLSGLQVSTAALSDPATFEAVSSEVNGDSVQAAASADAVPGRYQVEVEQLAQASSVATERVDDAAQPLGAGTLSFTFGNGETLEIEIAEEASSLADIRDAINAENAGVTASIIHDGQGYRLSLVSSETGTDAAVTGIQVEGDLAGRLVMDAEQDQNGAFIEGGTGTYVAAQNALLTVNGVAITSQSNMVEGAIQGVTLSLEEVGRSTVTVQQDTDVAKQAIVAFVDSYNALRATIGHLTSFDASDSDEKEGSTGGALLGNSTLRSIESQLRSVMNAGVEGDGYNWLFEIGITLNVDGTLRLDEAKLDEAIANDFSGVQAFFVGDAENPGLAQQLDDALEAILADGGTLDLAVSSLESQIERLDQQYIRTEQQIERTMERYRAQFVQLDLMVAQMNQTSQYLTEQFDMMNAQMGRK